ncbi:MAG: hypothetical protein KY393_02855 [Actinobacteria bacterium]|nr:hypothetical protein [Actinomycetota bacterium]
MSRGGRRRKSRRRVPPPAKSQPASPSDAPSKKDRAGGAQNDSGVEVSVVEQMRTHTKRLQTFPPDEVELDDLIAGLQSEYGIPPTPQEYRLVIKTPSAEPEAAADPTTSVAQETSDATPPGGTPISTTGRRRRRRRSTSASGHTDDAADAEPDQSTSL